jgi:hypothetical protein
MADIGRKEDGLALGLAAGMSLRRAAAAANVSERTAFRRWADPAFRRRVHQLRGELVDRSLGRLAGGMTAAAAKLRKLLNSEQERIQLGAARAILELGAKLRDQIELEQRIQNLEDQGKENK